MSSFESLISISVRIPFVGNIIHHGRRPCKIPKSLIGNLIYIGTLHKNCRNYALYIACPFIACINQDTNPDLYAVKNDCGNMVPCNNDAQARRADRRIPVSAAWNARPCKPDNAVPDFNQYPGKAAAPVYNEHGNGLSEQVLRDTGSRAGAAAGYKFVQRSVVFYVNQADSSPETFSAS
jgi:hypothetical protein